MLCKRLKELRKKLQLSQTDFGKKIGKTYTSVQRWELGKVSPPETAIELIETTFNVNPEWLRDGTGEMFLSEENPLREAGSVRYVADSMTMLPVFTILPRTWPAWRETDISNWIHMPGQRGMCCFRADFNQASPIMQGDLVFITTDIPEDPGPDTLYLVKTADEYLNPIVSRYKEGEYYVARNFGNKPLHQDDVEVVGSVIHFIRNTYFDS